MNQSSESESNPEHSAQLIPSFLPKETPQIHNLPEFGSEEVSSFRHLNWSHANSLRHYKESGACPLLPGEFVRIREGKVVRLTFDMLTPEEKTSIQNGLDLSSTDVSPIVSALDLFLPNR